MVLTQIPNMGIQASVSSAQRPAVERPRFSAVRSSRVLAGMFAELNDIPLGVKTIAHFESLKRPLLVS